jgi:hypothetical protein
LFGCLIPTAHAVGYWYTAPPGLKMNEYWFCLPPTFLLSLVRVSIGALLKQYGAHGLER